MKRSFIENKRELKRFIENNDDSPDVVIPKRFLQNLIKDWEEERYKLINKDDLNPKSYLIR